MMKAQENCERSPGHVSLMRVVWSRGVQIYDGGLGSMAEGENGFESRIGVMGFIWGTGYRGEAIQRYV